ncbi:lysophospholipid acyltransferase family protein [Luteimonas deserti]|uniref:1-acyl-sn-glycerol-3-phosphate acyltransferase n=1 Tax=Luteimonas deserti TaxID=2752306 RepID=A0A7Z0QNP9_9GAMM|nr:lysophospholipid acyltransferase family protein [Luteimonas deserti]NYZ61976.1 1-acyl-sn-glycerol-3-phosphate acyltransferase [Luteimonas deserti]
MTSPPMPARAGGLPARALRYAVRVPLLLWHVFVHLPVVLLLGAPPLARRRWASGDPPGHRAIRWWQGGLMRLFGFRLRRIGTPLPGAVLFVANHVSWIDISALHSQRMMGFVAKREIAGWPVVGWLAARGDTIFHQRGNQESLGGVLEAMLGRLRAGQAVGVFPEGRTRGGDRVGPFHARIFQAAVQGNVAVQPVALRYGAGGCAQTIVAFGERESFFANFMRLLGEPAREAEVVFLEPILPGNTEGRRRMAELSRERIVAALGPVG